MIAASNGAKKDEVQQNAKKGTAQAFKSSANYEKENKTKKNHSNHTVIRCYFPTLCFYPGDINTGEPEAYQTQRQTKTQLSVTDHGVILLRHPTYSCVSQGGMAMGCDCTGGDAVWGGWQMVIDTVIWAGEEED